MNVYSKVGFKLSVFLLVFLCSPVNATLEYSKNFDLDYGIASTNGATYGDSISSGYQFYEQSDPSTNSLVYSSPVAPFSTYTHKSVLLWDWGDGCSTSHENWVSNTISQYNYLYNAQLGFDYKMAVAGYEGQYKLCFGDSGKGSNACTDWTDFTNAGWARFDINLQNMTFTDSGYNDINEIAIHQRDNEAGCAQGSSLAFANVTLISENRIPGRIQIIESGTGLPVENANVTINGVTYTHSNLTDSDGYAFNDVWIYPDTDYNVTITKDGYYTKEDKTFSFGPCSVFVDSINTDSAYFSTCMFGTWSLTQEAGGGAGPGGSTTVYNFTVVNQNNEGIQDAVIDITLQSFPFTSVSQYTDVNGFMNITLSSDTLYEVSVTKDNYEYMVTSLYTDSDLSGFQIKYTYGAPTIRFTMKTMLCSDVAFFPFLTDWYVNETITDEWVEYSTLFSADLDDTSGIKRIQWYLNGLKYSNEYPNLEIVFQEYGTFEVSVLVEQTGCTVSKDWLVKLSRNTNYSGNESSYQNLKQYDNEEFISELEPLVPGTFILVVLVNILGLFGRVGK